MERRRRVGEPNCWKDRSRLNLFTKLSMQRSFDTSQSRAEKSGDGFAAVAVAVAELNPGYAVALLSHG